MNTKKIAIVGKGTVAVGIDVAGNVVNGTGHGIWTSTLNVVNSILETIPTEFNADTVTHICLPDVLKGINSGGAINYLRTKKTGNDRALDAESLEAFKTFYSLYASRLLNVRFTTNQFLDKTDTEFKDLVTKAWNVLEAELSNAPAVGGTVVDTDKEIREALDVQIIEAIKAGNLEMMKELKAVRDSLAKPQVIGGVKPSLNKVAPVSFVSDSFEGLNDGCASEPAPEMEGINPFADVLPGWEE